MLFEDRKDAGRKLAQALISYRNRDVVVYALPRGGVVIGAEVARVLDAPLDLVIARNAVRSGERRRGYRPDELSRTSRTFRTRTSRLNGLGMKCAESSSTASSAYPDM